ncbi:MAG: glycosyltransferase family 39 protein, partial [Candidatus Aenigmatarchaeota archaeon]
MIESMREEILLTIIIILGCFLTFYPHLNYPYPIHVDEWFHISEAKMMASEQDIDWYSGKPFRLGMERGWHLTLSFFQLIFKLDPKEWIFVPLIIHSISIIVIFVFVSKLLGKTQGLIAAFLTAIIPSNLTIGGPIFLVPVNLSMIFIPFSLLMAFNLFGIKNKLNYLLLSVSLTYLLYSHPPSAMALLLILGFYLILSLLKGDPNSKFLLISILVSLILSIPNYVQEIKNKGIESVKFNFWITLRGIPTLYGYIPTFFFLVGSYSLSQKNRKEFLSIIFSVFFLIINLALFANFKINYLIPYQRVYMPLFILMNVITSAGFVKILEMKPKKFGLIILIVLLGITAYFSIKDKINTPLYHLIDGKDYDNFVW